MIKRKQSTTSGALLALLATGLLSACGSADTTPQQVSPTTGPAPAQVTTETSTPNATPAATPSVTTSPVTAPVAVSAPVATGLPCPTLGATATEGGVRFDCVAFASLMQWHPRGSKANPMGYGEGVEVTTQFAKWRVTVTGFDADVTARILAQNNANPAPAAGSQYSGLKMELVYLGPDAQQMVRNGVMMLGLTPSSEGIERWANGQGTEDDCWVNETVDLNATKSCMMPYELSSAEVGAVDFYATDFDLKPIVYFRGAAR